MVPGPRVELGTPASSGQRSTDELARHVVRLRRAPYPKFHLWVLVLKFGDPLNLILFYSSYCLHCVALAKQWWAIQDSNL